MLFVIGENAQKLILGSENDDADAETHRMFGHLCGLKGQEDDSPGFKPIGANLIKASVQNLFRPRGTV